LRSSAGFDRAGLQGSRATVYCKNNPETVALGGKRRSYAAMAELNEVTSELRFALGELGMPLQVASPILPKSLDKKSIPVGPGSARDS
jgi:hypothetical protein